MVVHVHGFNSVHEVRRNRWKRRRRMCQRKSMRIDLLVLFPKAELLHRFLLPGQVILEKPNCIVHEGGNART